MKISCINKKFNNYEPQNKIYSINQELINN